ncbi:MAG: adenosylmethionine--8-amino-7-oxononanoate transaminase [Myxococcota bacterium]
MTQRHAGWTELDRRHSWHPYTRHGIAGEPLPVVAAQGAWLELADGRRLLDGISSWWACVHGHAHPRLVEVLSQQAKTLDHVLFAGCTHPPAAKLSYELIQRAPSGLNRVFYSDNGSTAVEVALKASVQAMARRGEPQRTCFIGLDGGYHGDTFGAMAVGDPIPFFGPFQALLCPVERVSPNAAALLRCLEEHHQSIAAVILEPIVQGAAGMRAVSVDFVRQARVLCDQFGVFLIADEVFTGFGRTGTFFACEQAGITPDMVCLAKGLTNGMYPLAATLLTEEIFETFSGDDAGAMLLHGHTMTANPMGCALALASLQLCDEIGVGQRYDTLGRQIEATLRQDTLVMQHAELRRAGGIVALELHDSQAGYFSDLGERLKQACMQLDVLLRPLGNVLYAIPPVCISEDEGQQIAQAMLKACHRVLG